MCRAWLAGIVSGDARFGLSPLVLSAVVRITTDPRAFRPPSGIAEAFGFCEDLLEQPHCQLVEPGERHWGIFKRLCIETDTRGSRVTDAWFAALASGRTRIATPISTSWTELSGAWARIAARSTASWKRGDNGTFAASRPRLTMTWAGMSRHEMMIS